MTIKDITHYPPFFEGYFKLFPENLPISEAFKLYTPKSVFSDISKLKALEDKIYAPGKWNAREVLQHCIDTERIKANMALCFSRGETASLPGFDENLYQENTLANSRTIEDLIEEFEIVRSSTEALFKYMDNDMILRVGINNHKEVNPLALGFFIVGHAVHHHNIFVEKYYPLID